MRFSLFPLFLVSVVAQTPNSCNEDDHHPDNNGYFFVGVSGESDVENLDSAHGQKLPNSTWIPNAYYPFGKRICDPSTERFCRAPCDTEPGCDDYLSTTTCSILEFCPPPGAEQGEFIFLMPSVEAAEQCDFSDAKELGRTFPGEVINNGCFQYVFEVDHELTEYVFSSPDGCAQGQRVSARVTDFDVTADQCDVIGLTSPRLKNCDCRLEKTPSTLGEPCRSAFSDTCASIMQSEDSACCDDGTCISRLQDYNDPIGRAAEDARKAFCDNSVPGLCYNEDGTGTDTNRMGSQNCCAHTCTACGNELAPTAQWKSCTSLDGEEANCGFLSRYDREPTKCDFSLCTQSDYWHPSKEAFKLFADPPDVAPGFCFSGDTNVKVGSRNTKLKDVKIGDVVLVDDQDNYETVYSFGHYSLDAEAKLLQLYTNKSQPLEISDNHMVFIAGNPSAISASTVKVGDELVTAGDKNAKVTKISTRIVKGLYAPFTASGTIVVNGIVASNYVAVDDKRDKFVGFVSHQWVAHAFNAPHRMYCNLMDCSGEQYTPEGLSYWVAVPFAVVNYILSQNYFVQMFLLVLPLAFIGMMHSIELLLNSSWAVYVAAAMLVVYYSRFNQKKLA